MDNILTLYLDNERESPDYLTVNSCGVCTEESDGYGFVARTKGRQDYLLLLIIKGQFLVETEGRSFTMTPGQALLYSPNQPQYYRPVKEVPYETRWVHFSGSGCKSLLFQLNLPDRTPLTLKDTLEVERITADMIGEYIQRKPHYDTVLSGYFLALLGLVARIVHTADQTGRGAWGPRLEESRKSIYYYYDQPLKIEDLARQCELSVSRYLHLFKNQYGVSPRHYQIMLRMENAKILLQSTDLSIRQISEQVGYSDQNYFSRLFKQYTGYAPTEYRK